jgi:hypothetical protein
MASAYPGALDNLSTSRQNANPSAGTFQPVDATDINNLADAINQLEKILGINPDQGPWSATQWADVVSRLNAIDAPGHKTIVPPYSLIEADINNILFTNNTVAAAVTIPLALNIPHGATFTISQGAGGTFNIIAGAGVTLHSRGEVFTSAGLYSMVTITKTAVTGDFYIVSGDIVAP